MNATTRQWLDDLVRQHDERVARRGAAYVSRVRDLRFDPQSGTITGRVAGSGQEPYTVTLRPPVAGGRAAAANESHHEGLRAAVPDVLDACCTCPYAEEGRFLCKHTFAAATRLSDFWAACPDVDLADLLSSAGNTPDAHPLLLQLLDSYLTAATAAATDGPARRFCWIVTPHNGGPFGTGLTVRAVTETWRGGRWRRSAPLPWERVFELLESSDLAITRQDRSAAFAVRRREHSYGFHHERTTWAVDVFAMLRSLVDHERVFLVGATDNRLKIAAGTVGLAVIAREEGFGIVPAIDGQCACSEQSSLFLGGAGVMILDRSTMQLMIAEADPKAMRLIAALRCEEVVPRSEIEQLAERLGRIEPWLPVRWPEKRDKDAADGRTLRLDPSERLGKATRLRADAADQFSVCRAV